MALIVLFVFGVVFGVALSTVLGGAGIVLSLLVSMLLGITAVVQVIPAIDREARILRVGERVRAPIADVSRGHRMSGVGGEFAMSRVDTLVVTYHYRVADTEYRFACHSTAGPSEHPPSVSETPA